MYCVKQSEEEYHGNNSVPILYWQALLCYYDIDLLHTTCYYYYVHKTERECDIQTHGDTKMGCLLC